MEPCVVTSCKCSCVKQLHKYLDGETFIHIEGCPTPKNETIDFIQYGGRQLPQHVNDGKRICNKKSIQFLPFQPGFARNFMSLSYAKRMGI